MAASWKDRSEGGELEVAEDAKTSEPQKSRRGKVLGGVLVSLGLMDLSFFLTVKDTNIKDLARVAGLLSPVGQEERQSLDTTLKVQDQIHDHYARQGGMTPEQAEGLAPAFGVKNPEDLLVVVNTEQPEVPLDPNQNVAGALQAAGGIAVWAVALKRAVRILRPRQ